MSNPTWFRPEVVAHRLMGKTCDDCRFTFIGAYTKKCPRHGEIHWKNEESICENFELPERIPPKEESGV